MRTETALGLSLKDYRAQYGYSGRLAEELVNAATKEATL